MFFRNQDAHRADVTAHALVFSWEAQGVAWELLCAKSQRKLFSKSSNVTKCLTGPTINKDTQFGSRSGGYCVWSHEQNKPLLHSFVLFVKVPSFLSILNLATQWVPVSKTFVLERWWRNLPRYRLIKHIILAKYFCHLLTKISRNYFKS